MAIKARNLPVLGPQGFLNLAYWEWEAPSGAPVVFCAHGLTRNGRDFDTLAQSLSRQFRVVCPDLPGRGRSEWLPQAQDYTFSVYLAVISALFARLDAPGILWVGTSLGGVLGMLLASLPKNPVRRLVLNDVGPFLPQAALERIASQIGADPAFSNRYDLEAYLREVHSGFGALTDMQWRHIVAHSGRTRDDGRLGLAYDPKIGEAFRARPVRDIDLWSYYDAVECPTLVIRGAASDLLRSRDAIAMTERGPRAEVIEFPNAGHAPALMDEDQIETIRAFLAAA
ncbi:MAG: alpha/beta hydrolase [Alphaproteobacteria bacterium]|nr:alpha/beta hydrolase [Alphaproteobacteria bacterium]